MRLIGCVGVVMAVALVGCTKVQEQAARALDPQTQKVAIDASTPDRALKSYWAVRDAVRSRKREIFDRAALPAMVAAEEVMESVATGDLRDAFAEKAARKFNFARDITDVKVESESRAVILAVIRNTTPVPAGASMTRFDEERRRDGQRYKYVLEKAVAGWKVAEIWEWESYPKPDWVKRLPFDKTPHAESMTYEAR